MAEKAKHWITVKGAHIPLDEERQPMNRAGKKIAASAEHDGAVSPKADTKLYDRLLEEHEGDHVEAARAYYRSKLQGKFVKAVTPQGEVRVEFTGSGWQHLKANMKNDSVKAALTPHIPSIVLEGEYFNTPLHKEHGSIIAFHSYRKKLDTVEGPRTAIVDVAQQSAGSRPEHFVYGLTREGGYGYEKAPGGNAEKRKAPAG